MIVKIDTKLKTFDGKPILYNDADLTLKRACVEVLTMDRDQEQGKSPESGETKMKRYTLAERIYESAEEIDLSAEEIVLLKSGIAKSFITLIAGQAWRILEGKNPV